MNKEEFCEYRKRLGLTQVELAQKLDVTPQTVANWERGRTRLPAYAVLSLRHLEQQAQ